jgi:serine/threonine-protein kinase
MPCTLLKRPTAVNPKPALATDELIERFEREVTRFSIATVEIFDYGRTRDGTFYYAMEYIDGITLAQLVEKDGAQSAPRVAHILKQVCESLREAHSKGLVHRDIKPANIMICERGGESDVAKVLDFGLVKDVRATDTRDITQFARMLGTPTYMAPERIRNPAEASPAVDIRSRRGGISLAPGKRDDAPNEPSWRASCSRKRRARRSSRNNRSRAARRADRALSRQGSVCPTAADRGPDQVFSAVLAEHPWTHDDAARWWQDYNAAREMAAFGARRLLGPVVLNCVSAWAQSRSRAAVGDSAVAYA